MFGAAIHDHLELRRRNAALEVEMPLANYMPSLGGQHDESVERDAESREDDTLSNVSWPSPAAETR
jgi:hypothetical protein